MQLVVGSRPSRTSDRGADFCAGSSWISSLLQAYSLRTSQIGHRQMRTHIMICNYWLTRCLLSKQAQTFLQLVVWSWAIHGVLTMQMQTVSNQHGQATKLVKNTNHTLKTTYNQINWPTPTNDSNRGQTQTPTQLVVCSEPAQSLLAMQADSQSCPIDIQLKACSHSKHRLIYS